MNKTLTAAYAALGITVTNPRMAWSAVDEQARLAAFTVWTDEIQREGGIYYLDSRDLDPTRRAEWRQRRGAQQRLRHLELARQWGGKAYLVKIRPVAGESHDEQHRAQSNAEPWLYRGRYPVVARLVHFDGTDFRLEVDIAANKGGAA